MGNETNTDTLLTILGAAAFRQLVEIRGGTEMWVPKSIATAQRLAQWVGVEPAQSLINEYGGCTIRIPNGKRIPSTAHRIIPLLGNGMPDSEIAIIVGVTQETVRKVRRQSTPTIGASNA